MNDHLHPQTPSRTTSTAAASCVREGSGSTRCSSPRGLRTVTPGGAASALVSAKPVTDSPVAAVEVGTLVLISLRCGVTWNT